MLVDLPKKVKEKLKILDSDESYVKNWQHVAEELFSDLQPDERRFIINQLSSIKYGKTSPGKAFLDSLQRRCPKMKVKEIKKICKDERRIDIVCFLEQFKEDELLCEIEHGKLIGLANLLDKREFWENLADEFSYDYKEKDQIKKGEKSLQNTSCTIGLLEVLKEKKPDMTVSCFMGVCRELEIWNVVKELEKFQ